MWTRQWRSWLKWIPPLKPHLEGTHFTQVFLICTGAWRWLCKKTVAAHFCGCCFSSFDLRNYSSQPRMVSVLWSEQSLCTAFSFTSFPQATPTSWLCSRKFLTIHRGRQLWGLLTLTYLSYRSLTAQGSQNNESAASVYIYHSAPQLLCNASRLRTVIVIAADYN